MNKCERCGKDHQLVSPDRDCLQKLVNQQAAEIDKLKTESELDTQLWAVKWQEYLGINAALRAENERLKEEIELWKSSSKLLLVNSVKP